MRLSVIVPTYNRRALLQQTLSTIFKQDLPASEYEVIVVVDGSTDGTAALLRELKPPCPLQILEQANRGPAAARNAGAQLAQAPLLLFLDDDILCEPYLFREHLAAHAGENRSVIFGPVLVAPQSPPSVATDWTREYTNDYTSRLAREKEPRFPDDAIVDANSSLPRSIFLASGGFDETLYRTRETTELGLRLWKSGIRFRYRPAAVVHHLFVKTAEELVQGDAKWYGKNEVLLCRKHPDYRSHSALARLVEGAGWKRWARELTARLPLSPDLYLRPPSWVLERLRWIPQTRRWRTRWLQVRQAAMVFHSAVRQAESWRALRSQFGVRLPVLLYHHVGPPRAQTLPFLTVSPRKFARQVRWLKQHGYVGIRPSEWLAWRREGRPLPDKPVLLTFDDAYADIAEHALPLLHQHGFGAAVFVVTGQVGGTNTWDEARSSGSHRLMTAGQIREWAAKGIDFGAHSRTHRNLVALAEPDLTEEVRGSTEDLAQLLGTAVVSFAYPYGDHNEIVREHVKNMFDLAFACEEGLNNIRTDPCCLRRTMVQAGDSLLDLAFRVRLGWSPLERVRARLRLRTRLRHILRIVRAGET